MMRLGLTGALAVGLALAGVACNNEKGAGEQPKAAPGEAPGANGPVAKVNDKEITRDAFSRQMDRTRQRFAQAKRQIPPALEARLKENIIRKLVDDELIAQRAEKEGVTLTDAEVDAKLNEHRGRFGSPEAFKNFLERTNQTEDDLKAELRRTELRDRLFNKMAAVEEPSDAEVAEYYEKNKERYKEHEAVRATQVFWKVDRAETPERRKAAAASAKKAYKELTKKGADFKALISKYTDATPTPNNGDMGMVMKGRQVKQIEDAIFAPKVKAGDVVGPVESPFGFHIVKVVERKPEKQRALEEVAVSIKTTLKARKKSERTREFLTNLKKEGKIEVLEPGISLDPQPMRAPPAGAPVQLQPGGGAQPLKALPQGHPVVVQPASADQKPAAAPAGTAAPAGKAEPAPTPPQ